MKIEFERVNADDVTLPDRDYYEIRSNNTGNAVFVAMSADFAKLLDSIFNDEERTNTKKQILTQAFDRVTNGETQGIISNLVWIDAEVISI